jgi:hypothetical protein
MPLKRSRLANWQNSSHSFASVRTLHGTGRLMLILLKMGGCGQFWRKCARTSALAGLRICRDWQGGSALLEMLGKVASVCAEAGARKVRALEARPVSFVVCTSRNGVTGFASFASEIVIVRLVYAKAMSSPGFGSAPMNNTTVSTSESAVIRKSFNLVKFKTPVWKIPARAFLFLAVATALCAVTGWSYRLPAFTRLRRGKQAGGQEASLSGGGIRLIYNRSRGTFG